MAVVSEEIIHLLGLALKHKNLLPLDGSRAMTGDLTLSGALRQIIFDSARIREDTDDWLQIFNKAGDDYGSLRVENLQLYNAFWFNAAGEIRGSTGGNDVLLRAYTGFPPTLTTIATMEGGVPAFSLQRAGDIIPVSSNTKDLGSDSKRLKDIYFQNAMHVEDKTGVSGSFTTVDGKTVTVTKGIITSIV